MLRSLPKFLLSGSLLALALFSCSPANGYKLTGTKRIDTSDLRPIVNKDNSLHYKASIKVYNKNYSGLIILKQTDPDVSHLVFITEVGMKMFDYEISKGEFSLNYVFEPLNRPHITKLLEQDMKLILLQHVLEREAKIFQKGEKQIYKTTRGQNFYHLLKPADKTIDRIVAKGLIFKKALVTYHYTNGADPQEIRLKHKGLMRIKIHLHKLDKSQQ